MGINFFLNIWSFTNIEDFPIDMNIQVFKARLYTMNIHEQSAAR